MMASIKLKITEEVAQAADKGNTGSFDPVPAGSYNATIYNIEVENVRSGANEGKPRFNIQFRISEGQNENRRVFSYVPLYIANDFWKTQAFFKGLGVDMKAGDFTVPEANSLLGKSIGVRVKIGTDMNGQPRNEVGGFDASTSTGDVLTSMGATAVEGDTW
jgi:hypothetical protein|tara:strand:+ start:8401 stop:8883 length:483 start_codon:yes stop_codon:yes gene_type:complete